MRKIVLASLFVAASLLMPSSADARFSKFGTPAVMFTAAGPAGLKIEGKTNELDVTEADASIKIVVPLAGIDTGIALRNKHMREKYLETSKFPTASLVIPRSAIQEPTDGSEVTASALAQMTIRGQTKPVTIKYKARRSGATYEVQGTTHLDMTHFGVNVPSYLGVTVKPEIEIDVRFSLRDE